MEEEEIIVPARRSRREPWVILALILLFLTALPAIFTYPADRLLFNPQVYKQALDAENPYDRFPLLIGQTLAQGGSMIIPGTGGGNPAGGGNQAGANPPGKLLPALSDTAYDRVVRAIFPPAWLKEQAYALIDQFWAYFNFQTPDFHLVVDFRPVKAHLIGPDSPKIVSLIMEGLPPCNADQIFNYTLQALQGKAAGDLPLCRPPDMLMGAANFVVGGLLQGTSAAMPDQLDLAGPLNLTVRLTPGASTQGARLFGVYHVYRQINYAFPWAALALLIVTGLLAYRTSRGPFYWLGVGLLLPGLAALIITALIGVWISQIAPLVVGRMFGANFAIFDVLAGMFSQVSMRFLLASALTALGVAVMGLALLAIKNPLSMRWRGELRE